MKSFFLLHMGDKASTLLMFVGVLEKGGDIILPHSHDGMHSAIGGTSKHTWKLPLLRDVAVHSTVHTFFFLSYASRLAAPSFILSSYMQGNHVTSILNPNMSNNPISTLPHLTSKLLASCTHLLCTYTLPSSIHPPTHPLSSTEFVTHSTIST